MCGIAAIFNSETKPVKNMEDLMRDLLLMTQVRGMDSTGILTVNGGYEMESYKKAVNASDFISLPRAKALLADTDTNFSTIIHCRKKTLGGSGHAAAHPFVWEDEEESPEFGMVHNGTLTTWSSAKFESDSHWLSKQLYDNTTDALEKVKGAAALIWTDMRNNTNNFFTNGERPLFYGFLEKEKVLIVGSEAELLYAALARNGLKLKDNKFFKAKVNHHYTVETGDVDQWKVTEVKKPIIVTSTAVNYGRSRQDTDYDDYGVYYGRNTPREAKDAMAQALEKLFNEATGTPEAETEAVKTRAKNATYNPTEAEKTELYNYAGTNRVEVTATIDYYDEHHNELYLTISDMYDYAKGLVLGDIVIMRDVGKPYYDFLAASYSTVALCVGGMEITNSAMPQFIATGRHIASSCIAKEKTGRAVAVLN